MNVCVMLFVMGCQSFKVKQFISNILLLSVLFLNNMHKSVSSGLESKSDSLRTDANANADYKSFDVKEKREMKRAIMQGLGLKYNIDIKKVNVSQDEYARMHNVYFTYLRDKLNNSTTTRVIPRLHIIQQTDREISTLTPHSTLDLHFDDVTIDKTTSIEHSTLRMSLSPVKTETVTPVHLNQIITIGKLKKRYLVESKHIHLSKKDKKWSEFDVTSAVKRWLASGEKTMHLELHCLKCKEIDVHLTEPAVINNFINEDSIREKRSISPEFHYRKDRKTDCRKDSKKCCRQEMNFDLEKLGFSNIIQPKRFDAGICRGRCPPYYNAAHNHAVLQGIMWKKNKTATPRVCCAPSKLTHLEVLTIDDEDPTKLTVKDLPNMIVLECACS